MIERKKENVSFEILVNEREFEILRDGRIILK
jgi:hypothetical protein